MFKEDLCVAPHPRGWAIRREGGKKAISVHRSRDEAEAKARRIAAYEGGRFLPGDGWGTPTGLHETSDVKNAGGGRWQAHRKPRPRAEAAESLRVSRFDARFWFAELAALRRQCDRIRETLAAEQRCRDGEMALLRAEVAAACTSAACASGQKAALRAQIDEIQALAPCN